MDIDAALSVVGGYKIWHICLFGLVTVSQYSGICFQSFIVIFIGWEPNHFCSSNVLDPNSLSKLTELNGNINYSFATSNISAFVDASGTFTNITSAHLKCYEYKMEMTYRFDNTAIPLQKLMPCNNSWTYENQGYRTIVEEWNLVCDRNFFVELSQVLFIFGCLLGEVGLSFLIDKYGRKKVHVACNAIICATGVLNALSVSYIMFALTKIPIGMFCAVSLTSGTMASFELFDSKHRTIPGTLMQFGFLLCYMTLPLLAYFITYWRHLQLAISLLAGFFVLIGFVLPESVPWLYYKGKYKEAEEILRKMAKYNGVQLDPSKKILAITNVVVTRHVDFNQNSEQPIDKPSDMTSGLDFDMDVVKPPNLQMNGSEYKVHQDLSLKNVLTDTILLKFLVILGLIWFTTLSALQSIMLSASNLGGNRFINYLVLASLDIPAILSNTYLCNKFGRRLTLFGVLITGGIFSITISLLPPKINGVDLFWISLFVLMLSKVCYGSGFSIMLLYTKELFPTQLRSTCVGICQFWGRIGNILAPLSTYLLKTPFYWLPNLVNGSLVICAGILVLLLPEPKDRATPETIEDCHKLDESTKMFKCGQKNRF